MGSPGIWLAPISPPGGFAATPLSGAGSRPPVKPFEGLRALVFDMDQTLIDFAASRVAGLGAAYEMLTKRGYGVPRAAFLRRHSELASQEDAAYLAAGTWRPTQERFRILCEEFSLPSDGLAVDLTQ